MKIKTFESIEKGKLILEQIYLNNPEVGKLENCMAAYHNELKPDDISRCIATMSRYMDKLGELISELSAKANEAYIYKKYKYLWEYTQITKTLTVKDREGIASDRIFDEQEEEIINRFVADFMHTKFKTFDKFISVLQSRIGLMRSEIIRANYE